MINNLLKAIDQMPSWQKLARKSMTAGILHSSHCFLCLLSLTYLTCSLNIKLIPEASAQVKSSFTQKAFQRNSKEFETHRLKEPPELPYLPAFPLKAGYCELIYAQVAPNTANGQTYTLTYRSKDSGETILNWYVSAFHQYGWEETLYKDSRQYGLANTTKTSTLINAYHKEGLRCEVFLLQSTKAGYKTNFVLMFTISPSKH